MPIQRQSLFDPTPARAHSSGEVALYDDLGTKLQQFTGNAIRVAGDAMSEQERELKDLHSAAARSDLRREISAAEIEYGTDAEALDSALKQIWAGFRETADPDIAELSYPVFSDLGTDALLRARKAFLESEERQLREGFEIDLLELSADAVRFARDGNEEAAFRALEDMRERGQAGATPNARGVALLDASKVEDVLGGAAIEVQDAMALGDMERLPQDQWPAFIKDFQANHPDEMPPAAVERIVDKLTNRLAKQNRIDALLNAESDAERARSDALKLSELELGVAAGDLDEDDIEGGWLSGIVPTAAKRTELMKAVAHHRSVRHQEAADLGLVSSHLAADTPMDVNTPADRERVEAFYQASGIDPGSQDGRSQLLQLVSGTQIIPESVRRTTRALLRAGDAGQAVAAAELLSDLVSAAPMVSDQLGTTEKAFGLQVNYLVNAGTPPEKAVELARHSVYEMSPPEREVRETLFSEVARDNPDALNDFIDDDLDSLFTSQPDATHALLGEFNATTKRYYLLTGDEQVAREAAWTDLRRVWGATSINGDRELMKYPPPATREMLDTELEAAGIPVEGVRVVADSITARDGSYALFNGFQPVLNEQNVPARWTPERIMTKSLEKAMDRAKQARQIVEEGRSYSLGDFAQ